MRIEFFAKTDTGRVRNENQDSYGINQAKNFFFVCDGMGGGAAGDFASRLAVDVILKSMELLKQSHIVKILGNITDLHIPEEALYPAAAIRLANRALSNLSKKYVKLCGMGTTVTAALLNTDKRILHIYNVGDSRLYRFRNGELSLITKDHSKVSELIEIGKLKEEDVKTAEIQSMITRALGINPKVRIDYISGSLIPGDCYILCTDGLNGEINDNAIKTIIKKNKDKIESIPGNLIDAANNAAGRDNTTVIAFKVIDDFEKNEQLLTNYNNGIVTIEEETEKESKSEDKLIKKIFKLIKVDVPKAATQKSFFANPLVLGVLLTVFMLSLFYSLPKIQWSSSHKKVIDPIEKTIKETGFTIQVRTPVKTQLSAFNSSDDNVQKLQMIQDWYKNKDTDTIPLEGVEISIGIPEKEPVVNLSSAVPLLIKLSPGNYNLKLNYKYYKIITERMGYKDDINVIVEKSDIFKPVVIIMIPVR